MIIVKLFLFILVVFLLWLLLTSLYVFYIHTHPPRYVSEITPDKLGLNYEKVFLETDDSVKIAGWFIPSPKSNVPAIIVCHGYPFDKGNVLDLASFLYPDYNLFFFDFRRMGESGGKITTVGYREKNDLAAAVGFLQKRGINDIGALGFSLGGAVLIIANNPQIQAIVADSSFSDLESVLLLLFKNLGPFKWPLIKCINLWCKLFIGSDIYANSPLAGVERLPCPILFIHAKRDSQIPVAAAHMLYQEALANNKQAELWIVPDADHGEVYYKYPNEYREKVKNFYVKYLP